MFSPDYYKNQFVFLYDDIERECKNMSNYGLIHVTASVRRLLFDNNPLLDLLNKEKKLPITFCVHKSNLFTEEDKANLLFLWMTVNPTGMHPYSFLKKSAFLGCTIAYYKSQPITILQVLKFYAYVRGGVHMQNEDKKEYQHLSEVFDLIKVGHLSTLDHTMGQILQVIYTTLTEYKERLLA